MKTPTVAYIRVSTDKQEKHGVSLDAQRERIEAYASLYDIHITHVVQETASASSLDRPGLKHALSTLGDTTQALLVVKLDRLTRSVRDLGYLIETYFTKHYSLLCVNEQVDTRTPNGRMMLNLLTTISQWEREIIGERTRTAMQHLKATGKQYTNIPPYGYKHQNGELIPHPDEQQTLQLIHELRAKGHSYRHISESITTRGKQPSIQRVRKLCNATTVK